MPPKSKSNPASDILRFLLEKNRPYSVINVVDEMHGEFTKTVVQKALDSLVDSGQITCKLCGKTSKLYFAKQEGKDVATKEQLIELDTHIDSLQDKLEELTKKADELRAKRDVLASTRTLQELRDYRVQIEQDVEKARIRKDELIELSQGITPEEAAKMIKQFSDRCDQWKQRKSKCIEIIDALCEASDKKRSELIEEVGLETDESCNIQLDYKNKLYTIMEK